MNRFLGALTIAVGLLFATTGGLCSLNVAGNIVRRVGHGANSFAGLWFGLMPLVIGLLFIAAGIAMVRKGWRRFQED